MTKKFFSLLLACLLLLSCMFTVNANSLNPIIDEGITVTYEEFTELSGAEGNSFPDGSSAKALVNITKAGYYKVLISAQETSGNDKILLDVNESGEAYSVSFEGGKKLYTAGCFAFEEGSNTISFEAKANVHIESITVVPVDVELAEETTFEAEKFVSTNLTAKATDRYVDKTDSGVDNVGAIQYNNNDLWASYRVYSESTALYDITMHCYNLKERNVFSVTDMNDNELATGKYVSANEYVFKDVALSEGLNEIKIKSKSGLFVSITQTNSVYSYALSFVRTKSIGEYEVSSSAETIIEPSGFLNRTEGTEKSGTAILMSGEGEASYVLKADRAGYYKILLDGQTTEDTKAEVNVSVNEEEFISKFVDRQRRNTAGRFYLEEGKNNLTLKIKSGEVKITNIRVIFIEFDILDENVVVIPAQDYWQTTTSETDFVDNQYSGYSITTEELGKLVGAVAVVNEGSVTYRLNVQEEGIYRLSSVVTMNIESVPFELTVNDKVIGTKRMQKTNTDNNVVYTDLGIVSLDEGENTFKLRDTSGTGDYIFLYGFGVKKECGIIETDGLEVLGKTVENGGSVSKGADTFCVKFTEEIDGDLFNSSNVKFTSGGTAVDVICQSEGKNGYVIVKEALEKNKTYEISVSGITDKFGIYSADDAFFTFTTDGEDEGYSKVKIESAGYVDEKAIIKGCVLTERETGIKGRKVSAYYHRGANGEFEYAQETVSADSGEFEITFTMPSGSETDTYKFKLMADYQEETVTADLIYLSPSTREEIFGAFKSADTPEKVYEVLDIYKDKLMINPAIDLLLVSDKDKYYAHFEKKLFGGYEEFITFYKANIALEIVNQTSSGGEFVIENLLTNDDLCAAAGIDNEKASYIVNNKNEFLSQIVGMTLTDAEDLKAEFEKLINEYLCKEYLKEKTEVKAENKSAYIGSGVEILLDLLAEQTDVTEICYTLTTDTKGLFDGALVEKVNGINAEATIEDRKITVKANSSNGEMSEVCTVKLVANESLGENVVKIEGMVSYDVGIPYAIELPLKDKEVTITISKNTSDAPLKESISSNGTSGSPGKSNGGGGNGGGTSFVPDVPDAPIDKPQTDSFYFDDLDSVSWAEESINTLLAKGIISESVDKKFNPNTNVKREEFAKMLVLALEITKPGENVKTFKDVPKDAWYYDYVNLAASYGLINGYDDGTFGSGKYITREEMATLIYRILISLGAKKPENVETFADDYLISDYAKEAVSAIKTFEIMNGVGDNMFAPKNNVTRAMSAKVVFNMLKVVGK